MYQFQFLFSNLSSSLSLSRTKSAVLLPLMPSNEPDRFSSLVWHFQYSKSVNIFRFLESHCQYSGKDCQEMVDCIFPTDEVRSSKWSPCVKQTLSTGVQNLTLTNLVTKASARVSRACSIRFLAKTILIYHVQNSENKLTRFKGIM